MSRITSSIAVGANRVLGFADLKLVRDREHDWADPATFVPFKETVQAAARAGIPVGQWIDQKYNVAGANERTIEELKGLGVFEGDIARVCEIGPGSGRYLQPVKTLTGAQHYEIYETAAPWANWLRETFDVTLRPTDGRSLAETSDQSIDLVHSHKVMVVVPFLAMCRYFLEMIRVVRGDGVVVFDAHTDECVPGDTVQKWMDTDIYSSTYPSFITRQIIVDFFDSRGFDLLGTFLIPMKPGSTQYFAFRRRTSR